MDISFVIIMWAAWWLFFTCVLAEKLLDQICSLRLHRKICSKVEMQQSNEACCSVGNVALVKFLQEPSWVSKNNAHSSSGWSSLSSGYLFTLQTLLCADTTQARRRLHCVSVKKKATHPLHRLYGVTTRDGRKDCNNIDSLAHRMRGPIKAGGEETLGLISVRECPLPRSICPSGER